MLYRFAALTERDARAIIGWRYDEPYSFYNIDPVVLDITVREMLDGSHRAVVDEKGVLVGFFVVGPMAQVPGGHEQGVYTGDNTLDIGLGLRPDLTDLGLGLSFVQACLDFALQEFKPATFRLVVATFNRRAIRVYERAGFRRVTTFTSKTSKGDTEFLLMTRYAWIYAVPTNKE
jgi:RimJ/RimL family protein N-acetyltransferase